MKPDLFSITGEFENWESIPQHDKEAPLKGKIHGWLGQFGIYSELLSYAKATLVNDYNTKFNKIYEDALNGTVAAYKNSSSAPKAKDVLGTFVMKFENGIKNAVK